MMDNFTLAQIAVLVMEQFLIMVGYTPSGGWDFYDTNCFRQFGEHIVISTCGRATPIAERDVDVLWGLFCDYMTEHNSLASAVKFAPYNIERYDYADGTFIYISVSQ